MCVKRKVHWITVCGVCVLTLTLAGCIYPRIKEKQWEFIRVVYLVREFDKLRPQSWYSADQALLARLQNAFPSEGEYVVFPKPHASRVNRIDIKLHGGQWWCLAYFPASGHIGIMDTSNAKRTFLLDNSNPETFFAMLTNEIMRASGIAVDLHTKIRSYEEADELGNNDAAYYDMYRNGN